MTTLLAGREQTRARHPAAGDDVERDGAVRAARPIAELLEGRR
jgi:hypothetical protein